MIPARRVLLTILGTALVVSCGDSNAPLDPNLRVSVTTAGVDLDPDGYLVRTAEVDYVVAATTGPNQDFIGYYIWLDGVQQVEPSLFYYSYYAGPVLVPVTDERYLLRQAPGLS
jgi:hypothetical protein